MSLLFVLNFFSFTFPEKINIVCERKEGSSIVERTQNKRIVIGYVGQWIDKSIIEEELLGEQQELGSFRLEQIVLCICWNQNVPPNIRTKGRS